MSSDAAKGRPAVPGALVQSMRQRQLCWETAVGEWLDNAIGNGATSVEVTLRPKEIRVVDNGYGCTAEMFSALSTIGGHAESSDVKNKVSRYGIGAKDGFLWVGGPTEVCSVRDKGDGTHEAYVVELDWDSYQDVWKYPAPADGELALKKCRRAGIDGTGVALLMPDYDRNMGPSAVLRLIENLNSIYWPAVESGIEISVSFVQRRRYGGLLEGKRLPVFIEGKQCDDEVKLEDGRSIRILAGLFNPAEYQTSSPGVEYLFGHRVLIPAGGTGCGEMPYENLYGRVYLLGEKTEWRVSTNKTGLHDTDRRAVAQAVYDHIRPLLESAASGEFDALRDRAFEEDLSEELTLAMCARKKAKRNTTTRDPDGEGKEATGEGGKHQQAAQTGEQEGNCEGKAPGEDRASDRKGRRPGTFTLKFRPFGGSDAWKLGVADVEATNKLVALNESHPLVAAYLGNRRRYRHSLVSLAVLVWGLATAGIERDDVSQMSLFSQSLEDAHRRFSDLFSQDTFLERVKAK